MIKKSYGGLIIWLIACVGLIPLVVLLPIQEESIKASLFLCLMYLMVVLLLAMIYFTQKVYWFSGIYYEEAIQVSEERRKVFALRHLRLFGMTCMIFICITSILIILKAHIVISAILFIICILASCIISNKIKL